MANYLSVPNTDSYITWRRGIGKDAYEEGIDFTVRNREGKPIAKAKITAEQLHTYICLHNTIK